MILSSKMAAAARRFPQHLKELRLHLCQRSQSSQGAREWVEKYYVEVKKANPRFPIMVRECSGIQPKLYARYDYGREESSMLADMNSKQVMDTIATMAEKQT